MKITDQDRINFDPMADECHIAYKRVKIVTVRKSHACYASFNPDNKPPQHNVKAGQRARYEFAIVDGSPHVSYHCLKCLDKMIKAQDF